MPALFVFLLKVNVALLLFCAGYYLVLRHLTFYTLNRIYLVTAILFASVYPQINLSGFLQRHEQLAKPVQAVVFNWQTPTEVFITPLTKPDYWYWVEIAFWTGAALMALRLLMQLFSLYKLYANSKPARINDHDVRVMTGNAAPFSFWKSIYINPDSHEPADLKAILLHEQVHVNEWHTLDILLAELSTIFYWFNPGIWLIKKAIRENIEFITDRKILKKGIDTKQYQYSLVNVSFAARPQGIVNHFNVSTIKKRIIMMNAKRSSKFKLTSYAFLVPAVIALLLVFSISKAALVNKSANVSKALATAIQKTKNVMPAIINNVQSTPGVAKIVPITAPAVLPNIAATVSAKIVDTIKKGDVSISTTEKTDSLNYVINGVKSNKKDFKALDPDKIYSIEILTGEQSRAITDVVNPKHSTLFVTTDDSEAGKKFKEKIDGMDQNRLMINGKVAAYKYQSMPMAIAKGGYKVSSYDDGSGMALAPRARVYGYSKKTSKNGSGAYIVGGNAPMANGVYVSGDSVETYQLLAAGRDSFRFITPQKYRVNGMKRKMPAAMAYGLARSSKYTPMVYSTNMNAETNISHLSSKLIMIDGKEASEKDLKKLSAADIDSMRAQSGDDITEKYGDKAKNGVLFITTKKASK